MRPDNPIRRSCTFSKNACTCAKSHLVGSRSLTQMQKWERYESARMHLECYKKKGDAFLHRIIALEGVGAKLRVGNETEVLTSGDIMGHPAKTKVRQNPNNAKVMVFSPTTVPASSSYMLCPSIRQSQASTTPISSSNICAVRCGRDHTFSMKTHQSFCTTTLRRMSLV